MPILIGLEAKRLLDFQVRRGIISVVRWNLRLVTLVIFGVEKWQSLAFLPRVLSPFLRQNWTFVYPKLWSSWGHGQWNHVSFWLFFACFIVMFGPIFRVGFWQNGFFADFYFWAAGFFRGFSRRIFSPHFCGKKCPEKSSGKIPGKILPKLYNKNPRHISAEGPAQ